MKRSIMLIDDDQLFNLVNRRIVEKVQFFDLITVFNSAKTALEEIKTRESVPQFILLDLRMPVMNGFEFLEALAKLPKAMIDGVKIIVLTSSLVDEDRDRSLIYKNVVAFLPKPLQIAQLQNCLN